MSTKEIGRDGTVSLEDVIGLLEGAVEFAFIDVRETGVHARDGHPLRITSIPFSRLEVEIADAVPLLRTKIVLIDEGSGKLSHRAAERLSKLGYSNVFVLGGGAEAWKLAGHEVYTGTHVTSIAFGEFVEHTYGTPHISTPDLRARLDRGDNVVILDSRTVPEFRNFSIPGAIDLPGAELVHRFYVAVPDNSALVVVNCAGRTRSIIGAQALINAGIPNEVVALANGTMDWLIEGHSLASGRYNLPARPKGKALEKALESVDRLRERFPINVIGRDRLEQFRREHAEGERSLFLLDVRTEEEFEAGHLPGSRWSEGGQLVQRVDNWAGVQNARLVLVDSADLVRAIITASWLVQINWGEVFVLEDALAGSLELGLETRRLATRTPDVATIAPEALEWALSHKAATVLDLDTSLGYRAAHIPGAHFAIRERLVADVESIPGTGDIVLTSADGILALFAAAELQEATNRAVAALIKGTKNWVSRGLSVEAGATNLFHPVEDVALNPYQGPESERFDAFRRYLAWEGGLVAQLERDTTVRYRVFPLEHGIAQAAE